MIKLRPGQDKGAVKSRSHGARGNNVDAPVDDESSDQERNINREGDQDAQQKSGQQRHADSTDARSTARGASGHRSGAPGTASSDKDSNVSPKAGNPGGREPKKDPGALKRSNDTHHGMDLDDEAKERLTGEGGPVNSGARRGDVDAPIADRGGTYSSSNNGHKRHDSAGRGGH